MEEVQVEFLSFEEVKNFSLLFQARNRCPSSRVTGMVHGSSLLRMAFSVLSTNMFSRSNISGPMRSWISAVAISSAVVRGVAEFVGILY